MKIFLKEIKEKYPEFEIRNYDDNVFFTAFNHDSREISENDLFIPIVGERFDGHDYISEALQKGASVSLCENGKCGQLGDLEKPIILVDSIREGLEKILNYSISSITSPIVAITGSTGKTTTKEMLVKILESKMKVLSGDNSNTVWGNAGILSKYSDEKAVVLECGMDSKGEIAWHVNSVDPDIGILLNIGHVHAEKLGSIEEVFNEKKDLADYMERTGKPLILNIDDERLVTIKNRYNANSPIVTFGKDESADFRISDISVDSEGTKFHFHYYDNDIEVKLKVFGEGYAYNAMAAIIAANILQVSIQDCVEYVEEYVGTKGRFEVLRYENDLVIINDAYNANPTSMEMSVKTFSSMFSSPEYHRIAVLGDMKELGEVSEEKHKSLGELVQSQDFDEVYYIGDMYKYFSVGEQIDSADEMAALLNDRLTNLKGKKVSILLKGSHSLGIYQIPDFLNKLGAI